MRLARARTRSSRKSGPSTTPSGPKLGGMSPARQRPKSIADQRRPLISRRVARLINGRRWSAIDFGRCRAGLMPPSFGPLGVVEGPLFLDDRVRALASRILHPPLLLGYPLLGGSL